jgi:hypothetical protein
MAKAFCRVSQVQRKMVPAMANAVAKLPNEEPSQKRHGDTPPAIFKAPVSFWQSGFGLRGGHFAPVGGQLKAASRGSRRRAKFWKN